MPKVVDHDERRQQYVDALWRVVSREGAGAISVRSVANEAGVSAAAVLHYLPSRAEVLGAALRRLVAESWSRFRLIEGERVSLAGAVDVVMIAIPDTATRRRQSEVWLQLVAEQQTNPVASDILDELMRELRAGVTAAIELFQRSGIVHPDCDVALEAERLHALIDGLSLHTQTNPRSPSPKRMRAIVARHIETLASPPSS